MSSAHDSDLKGSALQAAEANHQELEDQHGHDDLLKDLAPHLHKEPTQLWCQDVVGLCCSISVHAAAEG